MALSLALWLICLKHCLRIQLSFVDNISLADHTHQSHKLLAHIRISYKEVFLLFTFFIQKHCDVSVFGFSTQQSNYKKWGSNALVCMKGLSPTKIALQIELISHI